MTEKLTKSYNPQEIESKWYEKWVAGDYFSADNQSDKEAFTIVLPPPNVTGALHMGHALTDTIQDILVRWKRMSGYNALWLPGTDHAGIATQMVVERQLAKENTSRQELGRSAFIERVWKWKEEFGDRISMQQQRLGASLDWSRERFTMDEGLSKAVKEVFIRLYEQGLIYQDDRLVNWDPKGQTVLSDLEVEQEEEDGFLWHIAYPVVDSEEKIIVATTRPETLVGDTAVAIHPDDPRYKHLHGKKVALPLTDRIIPIITDPEAADMNFGSGAVKITPAHDFNDFATGKRNQLGFIQVIGLDAKMNENAPEAYQGLDRYEARKRILLDLKKQGLFVKEEPYRLAPGRSQRSGEIIEPLSIGKQWFVRMTPLAKPAIKAVKEKDIKFIPENWEKTYFHWMENIQDWCISRQLWWGHRIPAWHCAECEKVTVSRTTPSNCKYCKSEQIVQDEDVLDTWFSSALWPFSTLGWPEKTADLKTFYPTSVMETGFDIIFFWVARMIVMGIHFMEEIPFKTVYFHAMVRDQNGKKMSKSYGNVIDPLHIIDGVDPKELSKEDQKIYALLLKDFPDGLKAQGADALRLTLAIYAAAGRDIKLNIKRVEGYKAFMNKLWNAARFVLINLEDFVPSSFQPEKEVLSPADKWILTRLKKVADHTIQALEEYRFNEAAQKLYEFVWHELCDWYLELTKPLLYNTEIDFPGSRKSTQATLVFVLDQTLRLLHPIIPFITEEIWNVLPRPNTNEPALCVATYPKAALIPEYTQEENQVSIINDIISGVRNVRGESNISMSKRLPKVFLVTDNKQTQIDLQAVVGYVRNLGKIDQVEIIDTNFNRPEKAATTVRSEVEIVIPLVGLVDIKAERARIQKEIAKAKKDIEHFDRKLKNPSFMKRAPAIVIQKNQQKREKTVLVIEKLEEALSRL